MSVNTQVLEHAQGLESLLMQQGIVALAKVGLTAEQAILLRETGIVVITDITEGADVKLNLDTVEDLADKIVELVRL